MHATYHASVTSASTPAGLWLPPAAQHTKLGWLTRTERLTTADEDTRAPVAEEVAEEAATAAPPSKPAAADAATETEEQYTRLMAVDVVLA